MSSINLHSDNACRLLDFSRMLIESQRVNYEFFSVGRQSVNIVFIILQGKN